MISHFFIDRPIFAAVLAIIITIAGALVEVALPISEYPEIAPPTVSIRATYPGASAEVLARRLPKGAIHQFAPVDAPRSRRARRGAIPSGLLGRGRDPSPGVDSPGIPSDSGCS